MYQAIVTKYLGPTNVRGSRVKATAAAGSLTLNWNNGLNSEHNHQNAALALATKLGWDGKWHGGGNPDQSGYTFVLETGESPDTFTVEPKAATRKERDAEIARLEAEIADANLRIARIGDEWLKKVQRSEISRMSRELRELKSQ